MKIKTIISALLSILIVTSTQTALATRYISGHDTKNLWLKDQSVTAPWDILINNVRMDSYSIRATANRIAFIDQNNNLYVKEGPKNAPWVLLSRNVYDAELVDNKIFIVNSYFELYAKEGSLYDGWVKLQTDTYDVEVSSNRVIALSNYTGYSMTIKAKEGSLYSPWTWIDSVDVDLSEPNTTMPVIAVANNRIAYFDGNYDNFKVVEGSLYNRPYSYIYTGPLFDIKMHGERLCINVAKPNGTAAIYCKEGSIYSSWVLVYRDGFMSDVLVDKIAVKNRGAGYPKRALLVMEGSLSQNTGWILTDVGNKLIFSR